MSASDEKCVTNFVDKLLCDSTVFYSPWVSSVMNVESNNLFDLFVKLITIMPSDYLSGNYTESEFKKMIGDNIREKYPDLTEELIRKESKKFSKIFFMWKNKITK